MLNATQDVRRRRNPETIRNIVFLRKYTIIKTINLKFRQITMSFFAPGPFVFFGCKIDDPETSRNIVFLRKYTIII